MWENILPPKLLSFLLPEIKDYLTHQHRKKTNIEKISQIKN